MINSAFCLFGGILSSSTNTAFPVPSKLTAVFQVFCGAALATAAVAGPEGLGLKRCTTAALHEGVKVEDSGDGDSNSDSACGRPSPRSCRLREMVSLEVTSTCSCSVTPFEKMTHMSESQVIGQAL